MDLDVTLGAALAAGLLSFLSPCILPLVPPFLCYMAGVSAAETVIEAAPVPRRRTVLTALCFVAGFSLVFVGLGATASVFGRFIAGHLSQLGLVAGLVIGELTREARGVDGALGAAARFIFGQSLPAELADVAPEPNFGFSSTPRRPAVTRVTTFVEVPR